MCIACIPAADWTALLLIVAIALMLLARRR